ncbi:NAD(P)-dependent alcohol dehydrogenase [Sandarakinorhabdus oryzae]|uniref:NAD(P)-dependent alcohol dehydrogenase n=1 Tax=Sandarakinorhabdus oryzae TaxID=2675220 RepID=UPI0018CC6489|nr:NAD(P)-dependent alcohol dehydrogenase [Sandarakinorhabdus oryzae]
MPTTTRAAVLRQRGAPFALETVTLADPGPGELLVKLAATGICFTDVGVQRYEQGTPLPHVLGHEGAGTVLSVGEGVTHVAPGDRVVLSYASCGTCPNCSHDHPQYCANFMALNYSGVLPDGRVPMHRGEEPVYGGFFGQSSFADHAIAYARNTVKLPDDVPFALAAPFGCGLQTGAGTAYNTLNVQAHHSFAVMGAGTVGLAALLAAVDRGCHTIVAIDRVAARLDLARQLGATHTILADGQDVMLALRAIIATGIDRIVDTTGASPVIRAGLEALASRGELAMLAVTAPGTEITFNPNTLLGGRSLRGAVEGDADPQVFIPWLIDRHRAGRFNHAPLVREYPLAAINEAIADMASGVAVKPVLVMD